MWFLIIAYWFVMSLVSSMFSRYLQGYNTVKSPPHTILLDKFYKRYVS